MAGREPAAELPVVIRSPAGEREIGKLSLPATEETDSRLFLLDMSVLAPGQYQIALKHADVHPFTFEVVDLLPTTPIFLFTINACGESSFTVDSAGLDQLRDTHVQCWSSYGFGGILEKPKVDVATPYPAAPAVRRRNCAAP